MSVAVATFIGDLSDVRPGVRAELSRVVDGGALDGAVDAMMIEARNRVEDALQTLVDDVAAEFRDDISVPVDYSTKPPTRSKPGEYPRYDTGFFSSTVQPVVYRAGSGDRITAVVAVETPYAGALNAIRYYTTLTEGKWTPRVDLRLAATLR